MSDNKRPLGDFSQENTNYSKVVTSLDGKPIPKEVLTPNLQPSVMFSNPQTPGSFGVKNKPALRTSTFGREISNPKTPQISPKQKELVIQKEKLQVTISSLLAKHTHIFEGFNSPLLQDVKAEFDAEEINTHSKNLEEAIKNLKERVGGATSIEEVKDFEQELAVIEQKLQDIKNTIEGAIADKYVQAERLRELSPLQARYMFLGKRNEEISKKVDQATQIKIQILFSSLEWLNKAPRTNKEINIVDIIEELNVLEKAIGEQETLLKQKEDGETKKQQEALSLYKKLLPLVEKYTPLKKELERIILLEKDNTKKEILQKKKEELKTLKEELGNNPTKDTLNIFKEELEACGTLIEGKPLNPHSPDQGWPTNRFIFVEANPKLRISPSVFFIDDNLKKRELPPQESDFWVSIKENFDTVFGEYKNFLKKDGAEGTKELSDLIDSKKEAVEAIFSGDIGKAAENIEIFKRKLAESIKSWEEKIKKEGEDLTKRQEKNESTERFLKKFDELKSTYGGLLDIYQRVNSEVLSDEERKFITETKDGLSILLKKIDRDRTSQNKNLTSDFLEEIAHVINEFKNDLSKIETRLTAIRSSKNGRIAPPLRTRFGTTNKGNKITLRDGREITVDEWNKEQKAKYPHQNQSGEQTEEQKRKAFDATLLQHKQMYTRNPKEYLELYSHKNWVAGDINKKASEELLTQQLATLNQEEESLKQELDAAVTKLSTSSEEEKVSISAHIEELKQEIQLTKEEIRLISEISYNQKIAFYKNQDTAKTLRRMKEVYSPAKDNSSSVKPTITGPFKTIRLASAAKKEGYIFEEEKTLQKEQLELYRNYTAEIESIKERIRTGTSENIDADLKEIEGIESKINTLIKKDAPSVSMIEQGSTNHYSGMVKSLDAEEAVLKPGAYPVQDQAVTNPEKTIHRDTNSPEQIQKKRTMVGTLFETLTKNNLKKYANDWRVWAVACVVAGAGLSTLVPNRNENQVKNPQTLEQMMSWRDNIQEENIKKFTADFLDKKIGFEEIIKKYAKSAQLTSNNPESLRRLAIVEPHELLNNNTQEHIFGLSLEERKDLSQISLYLQTLVQATEAKNRMRPNFKQNDYSIAPPGVKLEEYFTIVLGIVTKVDEEEKKLKK